MEQIAVYNRTAQKNPQAIQLQKKQVLEFLKDRKNLGADPEKVLFFEDDGFSGLNLDRPGFQALQEELKKGAVKIVITTDLTRIGRSTLLIYDFITSLQKKGVRLISLQGDYDLAPRHSFPFRPEREFSGLEK